MWPYYFTHNLYWILPLIILELALKGVALWKAARHNQLYWFIALITLNTAGILPVIYLLFFQREKSVKSVQ